MCGDDRAVLGLLGGCGTGGSLGLPPGDLGLKGGKPLRVGVLLVFFEQHIDTGDFLDSAMLIWRDICQAIHRVHHGLHVPEPLRTDGVLFRVAPGKEQRKGFTRPCVTVEGHLVGKLPIGKTRLGNIDGLSHGSTTQE